MLGLNIASTMDVAPPKKGESSSEVPPVVAPLSLKGTQRGNGSEHQLSSARSASSSRTATAIKGARERFVRANRLPPVCKSALCPLSQELMRDPVRICNGRAFERVHIEAWFERGNVVCPVTQEPLESKELTPDFVLREIIQDYLNLREHSQAQQTSFMEYLTFVESKLAKKLMASRQQVEALRNARSNAYRPGSPLTSGSVSAANSQSPPRDRKEEAAQPMQATTTLSGSSSHASVCSLGGSGLDSNVTTDDASDEEGCVNPMMAFGAGQAPRNPRSSRSPSKRAQASFSKRQWFLQVFNM